MVDENRVTGALREVGGRVQDAAGGLMGDADIQAKGKVNEIAGQAQQALGSVADGARDVARENPIGALIAVGVAAFVLGMLVSR